jgi:hypothetical protein
VSTAYRCSLFLLLLFVSARHIASVDRESGLKRLNKITELELDEGTGELTRGNPGVREEGRGGEEDHMTGNSGPRTPRPTTLGQSLSENH